MKIGIIGGGQLGKMMVAEAKKMGFYVAILDPTPNCPAHSMVDNHIVANFDDQEAIRQLAKECQVLTYEFEHIDVEVLLKLEKEGHRIYPTPKSLALIQNKYIQKQCLEKKHIPIPKFLQVQGTQDIEKAGEQWGYPLILKTCTGGYDGKGNAVIRNKNDIEQAYEQLGQGQFPLMVEEWIVFEKEISVLACRGTDGEVGIYPIGENDHQDNILVETKVPAQLPPSVEKKAKQLAKEVMEVFEGVGMFCVEMFVTKAGQVYINEVAPRPHNSGHYTIEGCITSQFEQHIRSICHLPLGDTTLHSPIVMRNLLGAEKEGKAVVKGMKEALAVPGLTLHIYGKEKVSLQRKMGHFTVQAMTLEEAVKQAREASVYIKVVGE
ncbi:MAG: 5-(carboxyamino)imidazole ribonucleotide synthase [Epulopiscium sp.]|nr:5-(carboxyamino)imidazole ribonucleotide synthase [Candidatus Epulonipiscium sp.]